MFLEGKLDIVSKPYAPRHLGPGGRRLWSAVLKLHPQLRADEARILEDACREADLIDEMESEQKDASKTVKGSMGQLVAAPLVSELRQHRATLTTLLRALELSKAQAANAVDDAASAQRLREGQLAEAQARWGRREGRSA